MRGKKVVALFMAVLLLFGLVATFFTVYASAEDVYDQENDVVLNKTATLNEDGTYTITLSVYTTGEEVVLQHKEPLDIILLLDVSGSMSSRMSGNTTRLSALKSSVNTFLQAVLDNSDRDGVYRVSIVKFAGDKSSTIGNDMYSGYNYTQITNNWTSVDAQSVSVLKNSVNSLKSGGATSVDYGMQLVQSLVDNKRVDTKCVLIMFTDGEPNHYSGFDNSVANSTIKVAKSLKSEDTTVYTIGTFNNPSNNVKKYMNYVSSNYPNASSMSSSGKKDSSDYYKVVSSASELNSVFESIATEISSPVIRLSHDSVVKDIIADEFVFEDGFSVHDISVYTEDCVGNNQFTNRQDVTNSVAVSIDDNSVAVSGFDFSSNWCGARASGVISGKKLIIEINNIIPTDSAVTGDYVLTNKAGSGVYSDGDTSKQPVKEFDSPSVVLLNKTYILDYAKSTSTPACLDNITVLGDDFHQRSTVSTVVGKYGTFSLSGDNQKYTPTTMKWDGKDSYYVVGISGAGRVWERVDVIPANNVYYEDSFVTNSSASEYASCSVGIEYTGNWEIDGTPNGDVGSVVTEDGNASVHGWIDAFENESGYTDGSAHTYTLPADGSETALASVQFRGTGIDIYTKTDVTSGLVIARLRDDNGGNNSKLLFMDNKAASTVGGYYSIPTLSFCNLPYGDYTVTLVVSSYDLSRAEGRLTYCLDGIRVYNPISVDVESSVVGDAYGDESNARFVLIRNIEGLEGAVFVDEYNDETGVVETVENARSTDFMATNEVYLDSQSSVSFSVDGGDNYYIGMKSLTGETVVCDISGMSGYKKQYTINHTADMYYKVDTTGVVTIKNTGSGILALTKLKVTGNDTSNICATAICGEDGKELAQCIDFYDIDYDTGCNSMIVESDENSNEECFSAEPVVTVRPASSPLGNLHLPGLNFSNRDTAIATVNSIIKSFRCMALRG